MKPILWIWLGLFTFVACTSRSTENASLEQEEGMVFDSVLAESDWDRHQFYDDLEESTLDSLKSVIESADSVVAYNWNGKQGNPAMTLSFIVDAYGEFDSSVGKSIVLSDSQKIALAALLTDSTQYEGGRSMCFLPHIAFVYFRNSEIIGQSNVCFLCAEVRSVPMSTTGLSKKGVQVMRRYCSEVGLDIIDHSLELTH